MYTNTTAEFNTANTWAIQRHSVRGSVGGVSYGEQHIIQGSMVITKRNTDGTDINLGAAFIGELTCTFVRGFPLAEYINKEITVEFGLCVQEVPFEYQWIPMGTFIIADAEHTADGVVITAYDYMSKFDKYIPDGFLPNGTPYYILNLLCGRCGVQFGMTQAQVEALTNGTGTIALYTVNDCQTYRDILYWLAQYLGGFADIRRDGKLVIVPYVRLMTDVTFSNMKLVEGSSISAYTTRFGSAIFDDEDGNQSVLGSPGVGMAYEVGYNPFLVYGTAVLQWARKTAIFNVLDDIQYHPFEITIKSAPIYDLGDTVSFDPIFGITPQNGIINMIEWRAGDGTTIAGYGSNPNLQNVKDSTEKSVAEAKSSAGERDTVYARYENDTAVTVGSSPVKIVDILFSANKPADVEIWHEFQLETNPHPGEKLEIEATYYMDLVEIDRKPVETWDDAAKHLLDLHYMTRVPDAGSHEWSVYLTATNGTALIKKNGALAVLKGQGLAKQDAWDGVIVLDDTITSFSLVAGFITINDSVVVDVRALDHRLQLTDSPASLGSVVTFNGVTENCAVTLGYADFINFMGENYYMGTEGVLL